MGPPRADAEMLLTIASVVGVEWELTNLGPLTQGLPDDPCSCPQWGYVIKGPLRLSYANGQVEVIAAGDLFYLPPGHAGGVEEEFEGIEFSRPAAHEQVLDVVKRNTAATRTA